MCETEFYANEHLNNLRNTCSLFCKYHILSSISFMFELRFLPTMIDVNCVFLLIKTFINFTILIVIFIFFYFH